MLLHDTLRSGMMLIVDCCLNATKDYSKDWVYSVASLSSIQIYERLHETPLGFFTTCVKSIILQGCMLC